MQNLIAVFCLALGISGMAHAVDYQGVTFQTLQPQAAALF